jgi:hypothetical protein
LVWLKYNNITISNYIFAVVVAVLGCQTYDFRTATRRGDGQNKLLQINGSKDSSSYIINRMNLIQPVIEVEDMGFLVGKSSAKASLKLHLLWRGMQPLNEHVKIRCDLAS